MALPLTLETQETCLALALLDLLWIAKERKQSPGQLSQALR